MTDFEHLQGTEWWDLVKQTKPHGRTTKIQDVVLGLLTALNDALGREKALREFAEKAAGVFAGIRDNEGDYVGVSETMLAGFWMLDNDQTP